MSAKKERSDDFSQSLLSLVHALSEAEGFQAALQALAEGAGELLPCDGTAVIPAAQAQPCR